MGQNEVKHKLAAARKVNRTQYLTLFLLYGGNIHYENIF